MNKLSFALLVAALCGATLARAQTLAISQDDLARLGIQFAAVASVDARTGAQVPATVIASPQAQAIANARYGGTLVRWLVAPGERVTAGTALAEIKSSEFLAEQQAWIEANHQLQRAQFERTKDRELFADGIIAKVRLQQTERDYQQADFNHQALTEKLRQAGFDDNKLAQLAAGKTIPGSYFIVAQSAGQLTRQQARVGDYVDANATLAEVAEIAKPWLRAKIPASLAAALQIGQPLSVANSGAQLALRQKDLQLDASSQTLEILAEFTRANTLMVGQVVSLILPPVAAGVLVPASAVVHTGTNTTVFVRTAAGVEARNLTLRPVGGSYLAVEGIEQGEDVAVVGVAALKGVQLGLGGGE